MQIRKVDEFTEFFDVQHVLEEFAAAGHEEAGLAALHLWVVEAGESQVPVVKLYGLDAQTVGAKQNGPPSRQCPSYGA